MFYGLLRVGSNYVEYGLWIDDFVEEMVDGDDNCCGYDYLLVVVGGEKCK